MANKIDFKVCVRCFTFNQSKYIIGAMNGFCIQETDFPFVCCIVDDASTDGEQDVITKYVDEYFNVSDTVVFYKKETDYAHIIFTQHKENINCYFAVLLLKKNHFSDKALRGKKMSYLSEWRADCDYEAVCEGDDYWTGSSKLQKQVEFMDSHPQHSMCFHAVKNIYSDGRIEEINRYNEDVIDCSIDDMILEGGGYAKINAMLLDLKKYGIGYKEWVQDCPVGDLPMQLTLFEKGKIAYLNSAMSCYRVSASNSWSQSISANLLKYKNHYFKIQKMWELFDEWTDKRHHSSIKRKIKKNRRIYISYILHYYLSTLKKLWN